MAEKLEDTERVPILPRLIAFVVLAVAGAGIVWANTVFGSPVVLVAVLGTCVVAYVAGRLVGVPFRSTTMAAAASAGLFEGCVLGAKHYGWFGAVAGAVAGVLAVHLAAVPVVFVMVLFGFARQNDGS